MPAVIQEGTEIHYTLSGSGPPILLGHSFLCSRDMWAPQVGPLSERHLVINVDARGHGDSAPAPSGSTLDDMLADMLAVLDDVGTDSAIWAGLSMGGMVAMKAALETPERVRALILLDTDAGTESAFSRLKYALLARIAGLFGIRPVLPQVMRLMFGKTTLRERRTLSDEWRQRFASVDVPSIRNMVGTISGREDVTGRLGEITAPTLVIVGSEDTALPPECSLRIANEIPNAEYIAIEGAGHLSTLEQPELVTPTMLKFLAKLDLHEPRLSPMNRERF